MTAAASDSILWDVVEEHLDEAEYLAESWHVNLDSPAYLREEFTQGPQERLLAHVDGLVVGGEPVRKELLEATLDDGDAESWRVSAAALAMLGHRSSQVSARLFNDLEALSDEARAGVVAALIMSDREDVNVRITDALKRGGDPEHVRVLASIGGARGINPGNLVDGLLKDGDEKARVAAVSMLGFGDRRYLSWVEHCVASQDAELQRAGLKAGLVMGSGPAWQQVGKVGLSETPDREAMVWLASFASQRIVERLIESAESSEEVRADAIFALGFSGRVAAMEACLKWLEDDTVGPLAGEAFAAMTGLPTDDDEHWDDVEDEDDEQDAELTGDEAIEQDLPEDDDPDEDLSINPDDELRIPKADAIRGWWEQHGKRFSAKQRYLAGRPFDQVAIEYAFRTQSVRRHHALAFELLVRTRGAINLPTRALTFAADPVLEKLASLPRIDGNRAYGSFG